MKKNTPARPGASRRTGVAPSGLALAAQLLHERRAADAERELVLVLALAPRNADALRLLGVAQHLQGNYALAVTTLREAAALRPDDPLIHNNLGSALRAAGDLDAALAAFGRATELDPALAAAWFNLGKTLKTHVQHDAARVALERTLAVDPTYAAAHVLLGDLAKSRGEIDAAAASYRRAVGDPRQAAQAWYRLANLKTVRFDAGDVVTLRRLLAAPKLSDDDRVHLGYALSKALEDHDDPAAAFVALSEANRIKRRHVQWNAAEFSARIAAIDAAFAQAPQGAPDPALGTEVIFVVSLPRSGSTLTEQILAAHPDVEGANELPDLHAVIREESKRRDRPFPAWVPDATAQDWQRLGARYLERTQRWRSQRARFTDKGLSNWQLIGAAVAMLPGARFVNCRRDPVETCLSCFRQLFARGNFFSYDLRELGAYWRDYDRLSRAWRARYPNRVFDQVYEDLLADPEAQVRRLLAFLDLPWDPACLQFHRAKRIVRTASAAQVRQPLRRDTARAARYGDALQPLHAALAGAEVPGRAQGSRSPRR